MGVIEQLGEMLDPVASKLNQTIASTGVFLHSKLDSIEEAIRENAPADWNNNYFRLNLKEKIAIENKELGECQLNEIWEIQGITVDGVQEKSPAFIITVDNRVLIFSVIKEGIGTENISGNELVLPGETLFITPRAEGTFSFTIHILRRSIPSKPIGQRSIENQLVQARNVHDSERDIITSKTGIYVGTPRETESVDPTTPFS